MKQRYKNLGGNSSVVSYEIEPNRIIVWFRGNKPYSYSYKRAGLVNVEAMKKLANAGLGLGAFIYHKVRYLYD